MQRFDFNQEKERAAAEVGKAAKWDKARMYYASIVFCLKGVEVINNPFKKKEDDPDLCYEFRLVFLDQQGRRQGFTTTYRIDPIFDHLLARFPRPWHNMTWRQYSTKSGSYGYELAQASTDADECCCWKMQKARMTEHAQQQEKALPAPAIAHVVTVPDTPEEIDAILAESGFEPVLITEATQQKLLKATSMMMQTYGVRVDPGDFATMTEAAGQRLLDNLRHQWAAQSAAKAKTRVSE